MLIYDLVNNKWKLSESKLNYAWADGVVFNDDSYIYVAGGINNYRMNTIERYNLLSDEWVVVSIKMAQKLDGLTTIKLPKLISDGTNH